jgi:hypothetical protein
VVADLNEALACCSRDQPRNARTSFDALICALTVIEFEVGYGLEDHAWIRFASRMIATILAGGMQRM